MRGFNLPIRVWWWCLGGGGGVNSCNPDLLLENKNTERQWIHILFYQKICIKLKNSDYILHPTPK